MARPTPKESVTVAIRVREGEAGPPTLALDGDALALRDPGAEADAEPQRFAADHLFVDDEQDTVFEAVGEPLLEGALDGYNCSLFAYGQTGSGKTHTVLGYGDQPGLIPRLCAALFESLADQEEWAVRVTYLEIYNERVRDLLNDSGGGPLRVREHKQTGPFVEGAQTAPVASFGDVLALLEQGAALRTVASTNMNETSSRSHAVFSLVVR